MRKILLAGHSHVKVISLGDQSHCHWEYNGSTPTVTECADERFSVLSWHPNPDIYNAEIINNCLDFDLVLVWSGGHHFIKYLFQDGLAFDFVLNSDQTLPILSDAEVIPETAVRADLSHCLMMLDGLLPHLRQAGARNVSVCGTPPPKNDEAFVRKGLEHEFWKQQAEKLGLDVEKIPLTNSTVLYKTWALSQDMVREVTTRNGYNFIPVTADVQTANGFLRKEFYGGDIVHAFGEYGGIMRDHIYETIAGREGI